ncbi:hypothetical protein FD535_03745 [Cutibacterium acnes]|nr:hypothetical protein CP869_09875 [Cutibacterium acnes]REB53040.1 hypothetical protein CP868_10450 [Cutibacterium acnes]REB56271.1 hypothetical protein CP870_08380 [Cutibacterium acnes]REB57078.1 hypothetical protein CP871_08340 [Cutibacterium acnes]REB60187.1 hypothetical protein CP872_08335 [Cutibacterium acnes]
MGLLHKGSPFIGCGCPGRGKRSVSDIWMGGDVMNGVYAANICWSCDHACVIPVGAPCGVWLRWCIDPFRRVASVARWHA